MKVAVFNTKSYDREFLIEANKNYGHELVFFEVHLNIHTCRLAEGFEAVCVFVNDVLDKALIGKLAEYGVRLIALRCAGFNNIDLDAAEEAGVAVARVPAYSPYGVAEHAMALILALNRKIYRGYNRVRDGNFSIDGLMGFEIYGATVGIIGTGKIGTILANILKGFGCRLIGYDPYPGQACRDLGLKYVPLEELFAQSDIISLHTPLNRGTHHIINEGSIRQMKDGVMIINTSRGGLIDTPAVIEGLKSGKIGYVGLDVYEEEGDLFFEDFSGQVIKDDVLARLLTFPNVLVTGHQAFFTRTALENIAQTTLANIRDFARGRLLPENTVSSGHVKKGS